MEFCEIFGHFWPESTFYYCKWSFHSFSILWRVEIQENLLEFCKSRLFPWERTLDFPKMQWKNPQSDKALRKPKAKVTVRFIFPPTQNLHSKLKGYQVTESGDSHFCSLVTLYAYLCGVFGKSKARYTKKERDLQNFSRFSLILTLPSSPVVTW